MKFCTRDLTKKERERDGKGLCMGGTSGSLWLTTLCSEKKKQQLNEKKLMFPLLLDRIKVTFFPGQPITVAISSPSQKRVPPLMMNQASYRCHITYSSLFPSFPLTDKTMINYGVRLKRLDSTENPDPVKVSFPLSCNWSCHEVSSIKVHKTKYSCPQKLLHILLLCQT